MKIVFISDAYQGHQEFCRSVTNYNNFGDSHNSEQICKECKLLLRLREWIDLDGMNRHLKLGLGDLLETFGLKFKRSEFNIYLMI